MNQDHPDRESPDAMKSMTGISKGLIATIAAILAGFGLWQIPTGSKPSPTDPESRSTVNRGKATESNHSNDGGESKAEKPKAQRQAVGQAKNAAENQSAQSETTSKSSPAANPKTTAKNPQAKPQPPPQGAKVANPTLISKVTLRDQDGDVIYEGPIDLQPTLDRIDKGERNRHRNDGSVFQNREGKLPKKANGYYHEYVVPTPNQGGPGPQRLILGMEGEAFYTSDHYKSFQRLNLKFIPQAQN